MAHVVTPDIDLTAGGAGGEEEAGIESEDYNTTALKAGPIEGGVDLVREFKTWSWCQFMLGPKERIIVLFLVF